jgi:hypothetical protein
MHEFGDTRVRGWRRAQCGTHVEPVSRAEVRLLELLPADLAVPVKDRACAGAVERSGSPTTVSSRLRGVRARGTEGRGLDAHRRTSSPSRRAPLTAYLWMTSSYWARAAAALPSTSAAVSALASGALVGKGEKR